MRKDRRHVALGRIGLIVGALALSGCVTRETAYDGAYGGSSYLGYDPYWTPPLEYRYAYPGYSGYPGYYSYYGYYGYPGYSAYPRHYFYSPGHYGYQRYYGPTVYPPPPGHARRDRDRDDDRRYDRDDRKRRGGNVAPPVADRQPRSNPGSRRPPPEIVPTESPGDAAPTPRRRGRQDPAREVPE